MTLNFIKRVFGCLVALCVCAPLASAHFSPENVATNAWTMYIDQRAGFSIRLPKNMMVRDGVCRWSSSKKAFFSVNKLVPIAPISSADHTMFYVAPRYEVAGPYIHDVSSDWEYMSSCKRVATTLVSLKNSDKQYSEKMNTIPWHIHIDAAKDDKEIGEIIQKVYGPTCTFTKSETEKKGVYQIQLKGDGKTPEDSTCYNYSRYVMFFSAKRGTFVHWNIGQDDQICGRDWKNCYDQEIIDSFMFLPL